MARSCYIIILIKSWKGLELASSLQHWVKNLLEMFVIQHTSVWPNFILIVIRFTRNKYKGNFHYVTMPMMTSQILKSADFTETQKCTYLKNETWFFLQIKKIINYTSKATLLQKNSFAAEITFNLYIRWHILRSYHFVAEATFTTCK